MKEKRFSVGEIVAVLKQAEAGTPVAEPIRHVGIPEPTFYLWKKLVADLTLDKAMLSDVLKKSGEALS